MFRSATMGHGPWALPLEVPGLTAFGGAWREALRQQMVVLDGGDIPSAEKVVRVLTCSVGHPGVCRTRDAKAYSAILLIAKRLHRAIFSQPGVDEGSSVEVKALNGSDVELVTLRLVVAAKRRRDPVYVAFGMCEAGDDGEWRLQRDDRYVRLAMSTHVAKMLHSAVLARVVMRVLSMASRLETCATWRIAGEVRTVDIIGGAAEVVVPPPDPPAPARELPVVLEHLRASLAEAFAAVPTVAPTLCRGVRAGAAGVKDRGPKPQRKADDIEFVQELGDKESSSDSSASAFDEIDSDLIAKHFGAVPKKTAEKPPAQASAGSDAQAAAEEPNPQAEAEAAAEGDAAQGKGARAGGTKRGAPLERYLMHSPDGRLLGQIVWNKGSESLDAHCFCDHGKCHVDRTVRPSAVGRKHQGRPLGFLLAWLSAAPACRNRQEHQELKRGRGAQAARIGFDARRAERVRTEQDPAWSEFVARAGFAERPARADEDVEPAGLA